MTTEHPIKLLPELVEQWYRDSPEDDEQCYIATQAARWGADQELEACVEWLRTNIGTSFSSSVESELRAARRPKPLSLKEQALKALTKIEDNEATYFDSSVIRRALEQLDD